MCTPGVAWVGVSTAVDVHCAALNVRLGVLTSALRTIVLFSKFVDGTTRLSTTVPEPFLSLAPSLMLPFQVLLLAAHAAAAKSIGKATTGAVPPATSASPGAIVPERFQVKMSEPLPTATSCQPVRLTLAAPEL
ncbi:MAG: hypothetical protein IPG61_11025 [bacterium]|nr:hypothetical protein [bacterium]